MLTDGCCITDLAFQLHRADKTGKSPFPEVWFERDRVAVMSTFIAGKFPKAIPKQVLHLVGTKMAKGSVKDVIQKLQHSALGKVNGNIEKVKQAFADSIRSDFRVSAAVMLLAAAIIYWRYPADRRGKYQLHKRPPEYQ